MYPIGIGSPVNRPGYDPITGAFLGSNQDLVNSGSYYYDTDGALVANNSGVSHAGHTGTNYQLGGWAGRGYGSAVPRGTTGGTGGIGGTNPQVLPGYTPPGVVGMPSPLGGDTPLASAVLQGYGMGLAPFQSNYLDNVGQSLWSNAMTNWNENLNPSMNNQAITAGGYGGDRSNLAKGVMMDKLNQSVFSAMAPQYASSYDKWLDRGVQTGQSAQQGLLGLGQLDIGAYNAQTNAASSASQAAGVPNYTNPWLSGIGTALGLYSMFQK